jgi:hypothetical protein
MHHWSKAKHRIDIDVKVKQKWMEFKTQQVIMNSKENQDINLILDNIKSKSPTSKRLIGLLNVF